MQGERNSPGAIRWSGAVRALLARLRGDEQGAVALIFALVSVFVVVPAVLIGVDAYVATSQKDRLQDSLDAATLFAARSSADTDEELQVLGEKALKANLEIIGGEPAVLMSSSFTISEDNSIVTGTATVKPHTFFNWCQEWEKDAFCWTGGPVTSTAQVERGLQTVEIALVLDNTGSMQTGSRMGRLRTSSKDMIDTLKDAAEATGQSSSLRIALVPFSNTVRVLSDNNLNNYTGATGGVSGVPTWVDPRGQAHATAGQEIFSVSLTDRLLMMKAVNEDWNGCVESRRAPHDVLDTAPTTATPATLFTPFFWPDEPDSVGNDTNNYLPDEVAGGQPWMTRLKNIGKYDENAKNGTFNMQSGYGNPYRYGPNAGCDRLSAMVRLTSNWQSLKTNINAMHPIGDTNITIGLMWGWLAVSPTGPFSDGVAYGTPRSKKIIVLMTDGENDYRNPFWLDPPFTSSAYGNESFYGGFGYIWQNMIPGATSASTDAQRRTAMDARMTLLCNNIKARGVIIYTVLLEVPNPTSNVVQNCATEPGKFYDVDDANDLDDAFDAIAEDIKALRLMH